LRLGAMRARAHPVHRAAARFDPHEIIAEIVELPLHLGLARLADGDHANDRRDADRDAEDREQAAHLVREQRPERGPKQGSVTHMEPPSRAGSSRLTPLSSPGRMCPSKRTLERALPTPDLWHCDLRPRPCPLRLANCLRAP